MKQYWNEGSFVPDVDGSIIFIVQSAPTSWDEAILLKITDDSSNSKTLWRRDLSLDDARTLRAILDDAISHQEKMVELEKQENKDAV